MIHSYFRPIMLGVSLAVTVPVTSLAAQTRFEWPDSRVDVTQYRYIESCMAAALRVKDSLYANSEVLRDTIAQSLLDPNEALPAPILAVVQRCMGKYAPEQIRAQFAQLAQRIFLVAGRDADAAKIVELRLKAIDPADKLLRAWVMDSMARNYMTAVPKRIAAAKPLVDEIYSYGAVFPFYRRMGILTTLAGAAYQARDNEVMQTYGHRALDLLRNATDADYDFPEVWVLPMIVRQLNRYLFHQQFMDSLRKSTAAFVAFQDKKLQEVLGSRMDQNIAGKKAPVLSGDFWFPESAATSKYPRVGMVSLIAFVNGDVVRLGGEVDAQAVLRRLGEKHPDAELILVGRTVGAFATHVTRDPRAEADRLNVLHRQYRRHRNAILSVSTSAVFELPKVDGRRLHLWPDNFENYDGAKFDRDVWVIDEDGIVVEKQQFTPENETYLHELIDILVQRNKNKTASN